MDQLRQIRRLVSGKRTTDGAGVSLVRVLGYHDTADFDPFLMLDAFDSTDPAEYTKGFPWHPHRGIETITYLIQGEIEHGDSLGNQGRILSGDCQWMTAGSGIIHQEMPRASERLLGAQLWLNLPARDKMTAPAYGDIRSDQVPNVQADGVTVRVLAGSYGRVGGAFTGRHVAATYLDVELGAGREWAFADDADKTMFIYIFSGRAAYGTRDTSGAAPVALDARQAVLFGPGENFHVRAMDEGLRFILLAAAPLGEPIAWGGPIVMNSREELQLAFRELDEGTFIKTR